MLLAVDPCLPELRYRAVPHRAPGFSRTKPVTSYCRRQAPSATTARAAAPTCARSIDEGFQAFNAARLGEACRIFSDKMLAPEHDTTIGLTSPAR